ncbi:MAG: AsmA-like C-terminal region-containing protein, partial [Pirellulales bacterium]
SIVDAAGAGERAKILEIEEVFLTCRLDPSEWVDGSPTIEEARVVRPTLRAARREDGTWTAARLWPLPRMSREQRFPVRVEAAAIDLVDRTDGSGKTATLRNIQFTLVPGAETLASAPGGVKRTWLDVRGEMAGDHLRRVEVTGKIDPKSGAWSAEGRAEGLQITSELLALLPRGIAGALLEAHSVRGEARISFSAAGTPDRPGAPTFKLVAELDHVRIDDPRLAEPITDLAAVVRADETGVTLERATARCGAATIEATGRSTGVAFDAPVEVRARVRDFVLNEKWLAGLPPFAQSCWVKYRPTGQVDIDLAARREAGVWLPDVTVTCRGTSFAYQPFPYRLRQTAGQLRLKGRRCTADLEAYAGNQPVRIVADGLCAADGVTGWCEVWGKDIELNEELFAAMSPRSSRVVRSLHPRGTFDYQGRFERTTPGGRVSQRMTVKLNGAAMQYERFPYRLDDIRGTLEVVDGRWTWDRLESGQVLGRGSWTPSEKGGRLDLKITATEVPLEEPLREPLSPRLKQVWTELAPRGVLDRLEVTIGYAAEQNRLELDITAHKAAPTTASRYGSISIEPAWFPYRIEDIYGTASYRNGRVTFSNLKGSRGRTRVSTGGAIQHLADGTWSVELNDLTVDRLALDRELLDALPRRLRRAADELRLSGAVGLRGSLAFRQASPGQPGISSIWDVTASLQQNTVDCGVRLDNMHGAVRLTGQFDGATCYSQGDIDLDAVTFKGCQFTSVRGPLEISDQQIVLGTRARRIDQRQSPAPISGKVYGGTLTGDAIVTQGERPEFWLQGQLTGADLARYAREQLPGRQRLSGTVVATMQLRGAARNPASLRGGGNVRLRDADIYELPVMVALLKVLSVRMPDTTAFSTGDLEYRVEGDRVYLDRINVKGDAISLLGKGEANFDRQIMLNFYTAIGRDEIQVPILRPLLGEASRQMMQIRVDGTIDKPRVTQEAFPGARQLLLQLQEDLEARR